MRIIPPPHGSGRWQVWWVSDYPQPEEHLVGRYRLKLSAGLIRWALTRQLHSQAHYEVRQAMRPT